LKARPNLFWERFDAKHRGVAAALVTSAGIALMAFGVWWSTEPSGQCDKGCSEGDPWFAAAFMGLTMFIVGVSKVWRMLRRKP